jgi:serine/threonine protein kinase
MAAIILSTVEPEVVLSFPSAKDLRMRGLTQQQIGDMKNILQLRFINKCPEKTLLIFGVPSKNLREYS